MLSKKKREKIICENYMKVYRENTRRKHTNMLTVVSLGGRSSAIFFCISFTFLELIDFSTRSLYYFYSGVSKITLNYTRKLELSPLRLFLGSILGLRGGGAPTYCVTWTSFFLPPLLGPSAQTCKGQTRKPLDSPLRLCLSVSLQPPRPSGPRVLEGSQQMRKPLPAP